MVALPYDPVLLREHAYQNTGEIDLVIPEASFVRGFQSTLYRGLGLFTYEFPVVVQTDSQLNEESMVFQSEFNRVTKEFKSHYPDAGSGGISTVYLVGALLIFAGLGLMLLRTFTRSTTKNILPIARKSITTIPSEKKSWESTFYDLDVECQLPSLYSPSVFSHSESSSINEAEEDDYLTSIKVTVLPTVPSKQSPFIQASWNHREDLLAVVF
ncbi:hypothetical protein BABINDRAFT_161336 [Babjeviella inositovora NRRL Y-12698]|uniref:Uncharacterized protein n=1 Tax=Babjeviella inositovora NRRL Y-12698 TaxID=984486 RepID=A0A1E3QRR9_9ASCO|nr:uncharacterized protein BABINDRAFT_161336 [Babjeviella inositovora NRRL Y-12698]ODQ80389.1 hypothetical protein BABINDRAFT_161336 [Babjeviella inositovora NRRL Y-12698]